MRLSSLVLGDRREAAETAFSRQRAVARVPGERDPAALAGAADGHEGDRSLAGAAGVCQQHLPRGDAVFVGNGADPRQEVVGHARGEKMPLRGLDPSEAVSSLSDREGHDLPQLLVGAQRRPVDQAGARFHLLKDRVSALAVEVPGPVQAGDHDHIERLLQFLSEPGLRLLRTADRAFPDLVEVAAGLIEEDLFGFNLQIESLHQLDDFALVAAIRQDQGLERPAGVGPRPGDVGRDDLQRKLLLGECRPRGRGGQLRAADLRALGGQRVNAAGGRGHHGPLQRPDRPAVFQHLAADYGRARGNHDLARAGDALRHGVLKLHGLRAQVGPRRRRQEPPAEAERQAAVAGGNQPDRRQHLGRRRHGAGSTIEPTTPPKNPSTRSSPLKGSNVTSVFQLRPQGTLMRLYCHSQVGKAKPRNW